MIVKEKLEEEYVTVAEVKQTLNEIAEERSDQEREMAFELRRSIDHANEFGVLDVEEARELVEEVSELENVDSFIAHKIADLLPRNRDELRTIYAKERYATDDDQLDEILNKVAKYR